MADKQMANKQLADTKLLDSQFNDTGYVNTYYKHPILAFEYNDNIKDALDKLDIHYIICTNILFIHHLKDVNKYYELVGISSEDKRKKFEELMYIRKATIINTSWNNEEIALLRQHYGHQSVKELAELLKRSESSIRYESSKLGLTRGKWTNDDIMFLLEHQTWTRKRLAEVLKRTEIAITKKLARTR